MVDNFEIFPLCRSCFLRAGKRTNSSTTRFVNNSGVFTIRFPSSSPRFVSFGTCNKHCPLSSDHEHVPVQAPWSRTRQSFRKKEVGSFSHTSSLASNHCNSVDEIRRYMRLRFSYSGRFRLKIIFSICSRNRGPASSLVIQLDTIYRNC